MKILVAIYDPEKMYAERLAEVFNERHHEWVIPIPWSSFEELKEYCKSNYVDMALVHDSVDEEEALKLNVDEVVMLHDIPTGSGIYKFQSGEDIISEVMTAYSKFERKDEKSWAHTSQTSVTVVYVPGGGSIKNVFAYAYSRAAAEKRKVLYISLEEFSGSRAFFHENTNRDMSDLLYYWQTGSLNAMKLAGIVRCCQGLDYVPAVKNGDDLYEASDEDIIALIGYLAKECAYKEIVVDMGGGRRFLMPLLSMAEKIVVPQGMDHCSEERIRDFEEYLEKSGKKNYISKMKKVRLSVPDPEVGKGSPDEYMWGEFGEYVRKLV